jgi:hypothetical protein
MVDCLHCKNQDGTQTNIMHPSLDEPGYVALSNWQRGYQADEQGKSLGHLMTSKLFSKYFVKYQEHVKYWQRTSVNAQ